jgi:hypothetical protein
MLAAGLLGWLGARRPGAALAALSLPVVAAPFLLLPALEQIGRQRSAKELAAAVAPRLGAPWARSADAPGAVQTPAADAAGAEVVGVGAYPPSLAFYLGRTILLATADGDELRSNYLLRHHDKWARAAGTTLRPADWWRGALAGCDRPRVFVVPSRDGAARAALAARAPLLHDDGRHAAYGPCAPARPEAGGATAGGGAPPGGPAVSAAPAAGSRAAPGGGSPPGG